MYKEIIDDIYQIKIPLPKNPLKELNSYFIKGKERNLIIDTGFNRPECKEALFGALGKLEVDLTKTDVFITHLHADHSGLAYALQNKNTKIYASKLDGTLINSMTDKDYWNKFDELNDYMGLLGAEKLHFELHPGYRFKMDGKINFTFLKENNILNIGDYTFKVIEIPGHTPGQIGLYEENRKIFFCGDHILDSITPNISFWGFEFDILGIYFENLKKVRNMDINYLMTAHRNIIRDHKERIDKLLYHHEQRLNEVKSILRLNWKTAYETAAEMTWDLTYKSFEDFPTPQKWFASSEALSHIEHLVYTGKVDKEKVNGTFKYHLK